MREMSALQPGYNPQTELHAGNGMHLPVHVKTEPQDNGYELGSVTEPSNDGTTEGDRHSDIPQDLSKGRNSCLKAALSRKVSLPGSSNGLSHTPWQQSGSDAADREGSHIPLVNNGTKQLSVIGSLLSGKGGQLSVLKAEALKREDSHLRNGDRARPGARAALSLHGDTPVAMGTKREGSPVTQHNERWQQKRCKLHNLLFGRTQSPAPVPQSAVTSGVRESSPVKVKIEQDETPNLNLKSQSLSPTPAINTSATPLPVAQSSVAQSSVTASSVAQSSVTASSVAQPSTVSSILQRILTCKEKALYSGSPSVPTDSNPHRTNGEHAGSHTLNKGRQGSSLLQSMLTCPINSLGPLMTVPNSGSIVTARGRDSSVPSTRKEASKINSNSEILRMLQKPTAPISLAPGSSGHMTPLYTPGPSVNPDALHGKPLGLSGTDASRPGKWDTDVKRTVETVTSQHQTLGALLKLPPSSSQKSQTKAAATVPASSWSRTAVLGGMIDSMIEEAVTGSEDPSVSSPYLKEYLRKPVTESSVQGKCGGRENNATVEGGDKDLVDRAPRLAKVQHIVDSAIQAALQLPPKYSSTEDIPVLYSNTQAPVLPKVSVDSAGQMYLEKVHPAGLSPGGASMLPESTRSKELSDLSENDTSLSNGLEIQKMLTQQELETRGGPFPVFQCPTCGLNFKHRGTLKVHQRAHSFAEKQYQCDVCGKVVTDQSYLNIHMRTHRGEMLVIPKETRPVLLYQCHECQKRFTHFENFQIHARTHTGEKLYKCEICDTGFTRNSQLAIHMRIHTGERPFKCEICEMTFRQSGSLKLHLTTHTEDKPYKCDVCLESFGRKAHLEKHRRYHTGERPFQCEVCCKTFVDVATLQQHLRKTHSDEKPFSCSVCGQTFKHKLSWESHWQTHTGDHDVFQCQHCDKCFKQKVTLQKHMRQHEGVEKAFVCTICGEAFWTKNYLQGHYLTHVGSFRYHCELCGEGAVSKEELKSHVQSEHTSVASHSLETCQCLHCGGTYNNKKALQKHVRMEHGIVLADKATREFVASEHMEDTGSRGEVDNGELDRGDANMKSPSSDNEEEYKESQPQNTAHYSDHLEIKLEIDEERDYEGDISQHIESLKEIDKKGV